MTLTPALAHYVPMSFQALSLKPRDLPMSDAERVQAKSAEILRDLSAEDVAELVFDETIAALLTKAALDGDTAKAGAVVCAVLLNYSNRIAQRVVYEGEPVGISEVQAALKAAGVAA